MDEQPLVTATVSVERDGCNSVRLTTSGIGWCWLPRLLWCLFFGIVSGVGNAWVCTWLFSSQVPDRSGWTLSRDGFEWHVHQSESIRFGARAVGWRGPFHRDSMDRSSRMEFVSRIDIAERGFIAHPSHKELESGMRLRFGERYAIDQWIAYHGDGHVASIFTAGWPLPLLFCATNFELDGSVTVGDVYSGVPGSWFSSLHRTFFQDYGFPVGPLPGFWIWMLLSSGTLYCLCELVRFLRFRLRKLSAACGYCGYSMVGIHDLCPECGRSGSATG